MYFLIGLGNPGEEYKDSRHNAGRMVVEKFKDLKTKDLKIIESGEFMNNSGRAVAKFIKNKKAAEKLIVAHDDIDLPLGTLKISFNKSSGGHRGVESVIRSLKTKGFVRVRVGISPLDKARGKPKKPKGEQKVLDFILKPFQPAEMTTLKKALKTSAEAIETIVTGGKEKAMNLYN